MSSSTAHPLITEAGDDAFFYEAIADRLGFKGKFEIYVADGRPKVDSTMAILRDMQKMQRVYAIVDRDFNYSDAERLYDGHCLVLDIYSVENFFLEEATLKSIGVRLLSLEPGSENFNTWHSMAGHFMSDIRRAVQPEHTTALWCRNNKKNCNLSNYDICRYVRVEASGNLVRSHDAHSRFVIETGADLVDSTQDGLAECEAALFEKPVQLAIRGHYFWDLFVAMINIHRLVVDAELQRQGRSRSRTRSPIASRHVFEASVSIVETPDLVANFLREIIEPVS
nr:DUF4435 domain-containing protein [Methylorubrum extorquens]